MSIRVQQVWLVLDSFTLDAFNPEYCRISISQIKDYMRKNPMPKDHAYSVKDLFYSLTRSSGALTLPNDLKPETRSYVADLINDLR